MISPSYNLHDKHAYAELYFVLTRFILWMLFFWTDLEPALYTHLMKRPKDCSRWGQTLADVSARHIFSFASHLETCWGSVAAQQTHHISLSAEIHTHT